MPKNRDHAIILLIDPPEAERLNPQLKTAFGPERGVHINSDLLASAYKLAKDFNDAMPILSYAKSSRHQDLTWLDAEDPGFLEVKSHDTESRLQEALKLAFFTGAKKAVLIGHLSPELKSEWLYQAFDSVNDRTLVVGGNTDGSFYLLGLTQPNLKILEQPGFSRGKSAEALADRARRAKLNVFNTPETYSVTCEEALQKWLESKETLSPLFQGPQAGGHETGNKKPNRRHKNHDAAGKPPAENANQ